MLESEVLSVEMLAATMAGEKDLAMGPARAVATVGGSEDDAVLRLVQEGALQLISQSA